jgi:opacity protein-like surface antigen
MKTNKHVLKKLGLFTLILTVMSGSTLVNATADDEWNYFIGGYFPATTIDATATAGTSLGDQTLDIDASFSDLFDNMDYGLMGVFIAQKGKLSINVDLVFIGLDINESLPVPPPIGPASANVDLEIQEHELYLGYKAFAQVPALEVIAGARYIDQDIKVNLTTAGPGPLSSSQLATGDSWVDPFIGLRYLGPISNNWSWILRGDIGGFGVGSEFSWRVDAGVRYAFAEKWEAAIGYKVLDIDYETGTSGSLDRYTWDGSESGITFGVGYYF